MAIGPVRGRRTTRAPKRWRGFPAPGIGAGIPRWESYRAPRGFSSYGSVTHALQGRVQGCGGYRNGGEARNIGVGGFGCQYWVT